MILIPKANIQVKSSGLAEKCIVTKKKKVVIYAQGRLTFQRYA